jgi:hypothetical protein
MIPAISSTANSRLRRALNGTLSTTAHNTTATPLLHGCLGVSFAAIVFAVIVSVEVALPPAVSVTGGTLALIFDGEPFEQLIAVVNETVPA